MSNAGQAVLGIVGGVIGFFAGGIQGAYYGFQIGYLAGTALFPTQLPHIQGPRLGEGGQTVSTVGAPIPWVHGTDVVAGNIIWASPIREVATTETVGGKGGPEQEVTTYTYFRSFALLLCSNESDDRSAAIAGIRRIWQNGKLVYDRSNRTGLTLDELLLDYQSGGSAAFFEAQAASAQYAEKMTIYYGTEDQLPDPVIESFEGAGNVPAWRGYAYVVFDDVQLKQEDGNRIPAAWKFEVFEDGELEAGVADIYSNEILLSFVEGGSDPRTAGGNYSYREYNGLTYYDTLAEVLALRPSYVSESESGWGVGQANDDFISPYWDVDASTARRVFMWFPQREFSEVVTTDSLDFCAIAAVQFDQDGIYWKGNEELVGTSFHGVYWGSGELSVPHPAGQTSGGNCGGGVWYHGVDDWPVEVSRAPQAPYDPCLTGYLIPELPGYCVTFLGQLVPTGGYVLDEYRTYNVLQKYAANVNTVTHEPLNPARPDDHPQYADEDFWVAAYTAAVARGDMAEGLAYGADYPDTQTYGYYLSNDVGIIETNPISLATIVGRICRRSGLEDFDVSDLEDIYVVGYKITRPMYARAAIEPLRSVGFFDVVESGTELKFVTRGKAIVASLALEDLGARLSGEERQAALTTKETQPFELPRQVRVHFEDPSLDYEPGEEISPPRIDTAAKSVLDVDLAVAMDSDQAAQIAEVLHRDFWAGRWQHAAAVDLNFAELEPGDAIEVPVDTNTERVRIVSVNDRLPNLRQLELVRDDDGTYISHATGTEHDRTPVTIPFYGPVDFVPLDLPTLADTDDDPGFYIATRPLIMGGSFRGAVFLRSDDGGGTFAQVGSVSSAAAMGLLLAPVETGPTTIFDEAAEILVELQHGELESRTEEDVLNGANAAAIGAHGRWCIVQFRDAENVTGNIWRLSGLLQGRRGTERFVGTSDEGDRFVMISTGAIARLPLQLAQINREFPYKAVAIGRGADGATEYDFTGTAEALKPFSPVHIEGARDDLGNLAITWVRRDRLGTDEDPPMSETVEDYEVDILDGGEVLRTISVSTEAASYTEAQQITDFGETQLAIDVAVYQISEAVGRGAAGEATL